MSESRLAERADTYACTFVDVPARIKTTPTQIIVRLKRRTYNNLLRQAGSVGSQGQIPWIKSREFIPVCLQSHPNTHCWKGGLGTPILRPRGTKRIITGVQTRFDASPASA